MVAATTYRLPFVRSCMRPDQGAAPRASCKRSKLRRKVTTRRRCEALHSSNVMQRSHMCGPREGAAEPREMKGLQPGTAIHSCVLVVVDGW
ncbi:uncharacterized protein PHACADRAFT_260341 [Phanerochaete carnosa HHB-10118-sp]|uniref:Uncharacterized protein n=1 Tax=Phanerochaete carnosa (strain HHB-10118-sp) TaxID=650164 RepID=K5WTS0_PHACS|nr:uncharacterized protein PHACADRAFT_260341 [Phanerochaete carnosa HHB-10118-sp]EKM53807.1 hypothetical protein PHACADRAFT_260341 [Phanerochaete carnosa HHB-10118-sp]